MLNAKKVFVFGFVLAVPSHSMVGQTPIYEPIVVGKAPSNESTVVALKDGSFSVFFINRPGAADKFMSISSRDGIHWEAPKIEFELPGTAYYANQVLEDHQETLHAVFHLWGEGNKGYRGRHLDLWYTRKKKGANKWEAPVQIFEGYVGSIRNFMQLKSGRLLMSFGKAVPEREKKPNSKDIDYGWNEILTLYSDDNGNNWKKSSSFLNIQIDSEKVTRYGAIEPDIIELKNGKLWMLIRTNKGVLYEAFSNDLGDTWTQAQPSRFISSDSPPTFLRLMNDQILLIFNMNQRWDNPHTYAFGGREVLHAALSSDEGKSWQGFREIVKETTTTDPTVRGDRGTAYASATEMQDGRVLVVSGQGEGRSIVIFDPRWLTDYRVNSSSPSDQTPNTTVFNFPATLSGELILRLDPNASCEALTISLTDHFSIAADSMASNHGIFATKIQSVISPIHLRWDNDTHQVELWQADRLLVRKAYSRNTTWGANYLRLTSSVTCPLQSFELKKMDR